MSDHDYIDGLIRRIIDACPRRQPTSQDERRAQDMVRAEFDRLGVATDLHEFRFNDNLHANMALHFGLGTLGTLVSPFAPLAGLGLHAISTGSYWADSTRRGYYLRRLFGFKTAHNLLATQPAKDEPELRIVILGHADAGFTGLIFNPTLVRLMTGGPPKGLGFLEYPVALAVRAQALLCALDLLRVFLGPLTLPLLPLEMLLTAPSLLIFLLNVEMLLHNRIVPGAGDNLSGVAALPVLAGRFASDLHPAVEIVYGVTGCEEASLGGADALREDMTGAWDKRRTVVLALDGFGMGDLHYCTSEGEVVRRRTPAWLEELILEVGASDPRFAALGGIDNPVGGSDAGPFLAHGWDAVCLTSFDREASTPRNYHRPEDTADNLDMDGVLLGIDFTEKLIRAIIDRRLGSSAAS